MLPWARAVERRDWSLWHAQGARKRSRDGDAGQAEHPLTLLRVQGGRKGLHLGSPFQRAEAWPVALVVSPLLAKGATE